MPLPTIGWAAAPSAIAGVTSQSTGFFLEQLTR